MQKQGRQRRKKIELPSVFPDNPEYIRVVREAGGLGDAVRCLSVCQGLKEKYPYSRVHYHGAKYLEGLIAPRTTDFLDCFIGHPNGIRQRDAYINEKIDKHLDVGINYDITIDCWCPPYLHEPQTKGVCCQDRTELWCQQARLPLIRPKINPIQQDYNEMEKFLKVIGKNYRKIIGIQVGATCISREYPYHYWDDIIRMAGKENIFVILFDVCRRWINQIVPERHKNLLVSIDQNWFITIGRILACDLMVTPDSGFYHLCGCINKKCLGLFTCTSGLITSRPYKIGIETGYYYELMTDEINYSLLPKTSSCRRACKPQCYMRWERGWDSERYRGAKKQYCALALQMYPWKVFREITKLL